MGASCQKAEKGGDEARELAFHGDVFGVNF
jgi:hypothetical protein